MDITCLDVTEMSIMQETGDSSSHHINPADNSITEEKIIYQETSSDSDTSEESEIDSSSSSESDNDDIYFSEEEECLTEHVDQQLYEGAPISVEDSMIAILAYIKRHECSGRQIVDLLKLIKLHCKKEKNLMKTTLYFFKKYFSCLDCPVVYHHYCSGCYFKLEKKDTPCPNAKMHPATSGTCVFVEMPLIPQLQKLFAQEEFYSNLNYKHTRTKVCAENLEDIYDGQIYKELEKSGFLSIDKPLNVTMIMNADGVPVFKSTNASMWPVFFNVNELPPHLRFKKEYTLIGGVWFGGKPSANLILEPLMKSVKEIRSGFDVTPPGNQTPATAKGILIAAATDLPAKIMLCGMASYSGAYGCQICKIKGGSVQITKKVRQKKIDQKQTKKGKNETVAYSSVWAFKYSDDLDLRSHAETIRLGEEAQKILQKTHDPDTNVYGVKYPSAIFKMMYDGIRGFAVDDLHTLFLGVTKTLLKLQFDSAFSSQPFSLRKFLPLVDDRLMALKLPNFLERGVRKIGTDLAYFKGTELQTWALYLCIPILDGIMTDRYLEHQVELVNCLHTMQSSSLAPDTMLSCENKLKNYAKNFEVLYGSRHMTMVMHLLRHLVWAVKNLGPMRYTSTFHYEGLNAEILKMIHGTRYVETQLASGCFLIKQLPKSLQNISSEDVRDYCFKLLHPSLRLKKLEDIEPGVFSVGTYKPVPLQQNHVFDCLDKLKISKADSNVQSFYRLKKNKLLFVSRSYTRIVKRNSSVCSFVSDGNKLGHGTIDKFVKVCSNSQVKYFAIIQVAQLQPYVVVSQLVLHISKYSLTNDYEAIPVMNLRDMLICVDVDDRSYVCRPI
ncbi:uncharacterized protein LOC117646055 isoform X2 [Thrips palmi]|nr:uncharacterized protein LOC117646055 isoform X2 [Thrips palmi]XP_034242621.1 uncharacterized protein LOC117646055 isoform X2 [Thrips palmi]